MSAPGKLVPAGPPRPVPRAVLRLEGLVDGAEFPCRGDGKTHRYQLNDDGSVTVLPMVVTCQRCSGRGCIGT